MARFNDFREPVEYIVDQYFKNKQVLQDNIIEDEYAPNGTNYIDDDLPQFPVFIIRDETGRAYKFIYGNVEALLEEEDEADPVVWQEELIRDDTGTVTAIKVTYPDGEEVVNELIRENGALVKIV